MDRRLGCEARSRERSRPLICGSARGNVLKILPPLPSGLEYRIVDTHLILMDVAANSVVDYMLDVMCKTC